MIDAQKTCRCTEAWDSLLTIEEAVTYIRQLWSIVACSKGDYEVLNLQNVATIIII